MKYSLALLLFCFLSFSGLAQTGTTNPVRPVEEYPQAALPVLIRGPYLQRATPVSMMIRWRTDALSRSRVYIGTEPDKLAVAVTDSTLVTEHKILVSSLQPETKYFYSIGDAKNKLQGDTANYFYTLPVAGATGTYRIAAFGDCGNNSINQRNVRDQMLKYLGHNYLNAWLLVGDNAYPDCTDAEYQQNFFNIYKDNLLKKYPLFPCPGNHDYHDIEFSSDVAQKYHELAYYRNFSMPISGESGGVASHTSEYYSFDIGNIHFLSINSCGELDDNRLSDTAGLEAQWIKKDLEQAAGAEWIVAYWHHPAYTMGSHNCDKEDDLVDIRQNIIPILERYGVDLVINGHSHDYERSKLMNGYYGNYESFDSTKYNISQSSGKTKEGSDKGAYFKKQIREKGTVYVVTGSSGKLGGKQDTYPHKALPFSDATHGGASLIEVTGNRLTFRWICADGVIRDQFEMIKGNPLVKSK